MHLNPSTRFLRRLEHSLYTRLRLRADDRLAAHATRPKPPHLLTGERGEATAFFHLRDHGYTIVARRWNTRRYRGDLDLIAWDGATLVVFEIKTRTTRDLYPAEIAVDRDKRNQLRKLAGIYLLRFPEPHRARITVRFDVLAVYLSGDDAVLDHFPAMFPFETPPEDDARR